MVDKKSVISKTSKSNLGDKSALPNINNSKQISSGEGSIKKEKNSMDKRVSVKDRKSSK